MEIAYSVVVGDVTSNKPNQSTQKDMHSPLDVQEITTSKVLLNLETNCALNNPPKVQLYSE